MGAGKNKNHRKKRISKHVLEAQERKKQTELEDKLLSAAKGDDGDGSAAPSATPESKPLTSSSSSSKTKDPSEASSYLTLWNYDRTNGTKQWKFNKNNQSWLFRHMYDFDKVSKATFALLVDYICQGGPGARSRVEEDAKRRARRYKEWEKKKEQQPSEKDEKGDGGAAAADNEKADEEKDGKKSNRQSSDNDDVWKELDDHDKRKEYKRARKVLDALKATRDQSEE
eukprot:CAMPEP_0183750580 /NCGR_PEP_ID=MMETSP0739-20130205/1190_1 /TAXON_ID=385413 /ORGANISM="Thalassiosira miniscula, Strain CCMP1093" /LENGTH=226 /DNA_ID=CAMNT_0025986655 /DNA_START=42 /DNA_END=722 /DNA_ORIENTATION=+